MYRSDNIVCFWINCFRELDRTETFVRMSQDRKFPADVIDNFFLKISIRSLFLKIDGTRYTTKTSLVQLLNQ
jgi:hypothetical protein